jgi:hypothetical protein
MRWVTGWWTVTWSSWRAGRGRTRCGLGGQELQHIGLAGPASFTRNADCDLDHVLVHIDRGHPVMHHFHVPPPEGGSPELNREQKAGRPTGPLTSIRRLTHALEAAAGMTRNGTPAPHFSAASNGTKRTGDDGRHASPSTHLPPRRHPPEPPQTYAQTPSPAPISSQASRAHLFLFGWSTFDA